MRNAKDKKNLFAILKISYTFAFLFKNEPGFGVIVLIVEPRPCKLGFVN